MKADSVFDYLVEKTKEYLKENNIRRMVLGVSGGIDSTVVAAICSEAAKKASVPLMGYYLHMKNKEEEREAAGLVGWEFCNGFREVDLSVMYEDVTSKMNGTMGMTMEVPHGYDWDDHETPEEEERRMKIAEGNIQARLRMTYLYYAANLYRGIVMDTDNLTEHYLGFFTLHGDQGDFNPIGSLWKTEVYELAKHLVSRYKYEEGKAKAVERSIRMTPTDGLGITSSDLEQIGAKSYAEVDAVLQSLVYHKDSVSDQNLFLEKLKNIIDSNTIERIRKRYERTEFKRRKLPVVIPLCGKEVRNFKTAESMHFGLPIGGNFFYDGEA